MLRLSRRAVGKSCLLLLLISLAANSALGQLETATVSGQVVDPSGSTITKAQVKLVDIDRDSSAGATTNGSGLYTFQSVRPGRYRMEVTAAGFKVVDVTGLTVNVQDHIEQNFKLAVGSVSESVTVEGGASLVNTESASVSTVVDRNFAENLPMNGRSFQTLIDLTPGVVLTTSNYSDNGQFSVNGQRAASNYWMVDGVSANTGIGVNPTGIVGNGLGGGLGSFSALGGTNSLVSVDAMQEFRIQTSTYAPEFGRTPGGQISIVTRSGTNQFHGTAFDYLRNEVLDANDWFNGYTNNPPLPKAKERQNDFGGTFGGPIVKNRMFFFFSYEGLRLRLPKTTLTTVPDASFTPGGTTNSRQNAISAMQPYLNAFPLPSRNSPEIFAPCDPTTDPTCPPAGQKATGSAQFNASYSDPATLDAYSLRIDDKLSDRLMLFGRYNYSPSSLVQRGTEGDSVSTLNSTRITTQTGTIGATWVPSPIMTDDLRFNYSRTNSSSSDSMDTFGSAIPLASLPFPSPFTSNDGLLYFRILSLQTGQFHVGQLGANSQRQINIVDSLSVQRGSHSLKFGVDYRRLSPQFDPYAYIQLPIFNDIPSAESGSPVGTVIGSNVSPRPLFRNLGIYAQDTWRISPRLTLTYGLRWDVDFVPHALGGPNFPAVVGFNLNDLSNLALAPAGTPPYTTAYGNVAPRFGLAYEVSQKQDWATVIRGGFGVFYDLASSEAGNQLGAFPYYPFGATSTQFGGAFPLNPTMAAPVPITPPTTSNPGLLFGFDPHLELPHTLEWNVAFEQALGRQQTVSASYIGAAGRRLLQSAFIFSPNPTFLRAQLVTNASTSDYNALQLQFKRALSRGLQALASYTWAHSIDTASAGSIAVGSNNLGSGANQNGNRGPSDFDIRNALSAGLTYNVPAPKINTFMKATLGDWSLDNLIIVRSAPPVDVSDQNFTGFSDNFVVDVRPDLVIGQPLYLLGAQCAVTLGSPCPGGKGFNPNAFTNPPFDPNTFIPLRQGNVSRNFLRGFRAAQWDFAVHRDFRLPESLRLQFRAELFNVLNHPNFGQPSGAFGLGGFGLATQMLGQSLNNGNLGGGALSSLYQIGGPRSIQFAAKLIF
jgi:hypothetical protein